MAVVATYAFSSLLPKVYQAQAFVKVDTNSSALATGKRYDHRRRRS